MVPRELCPPSSSSCVVSPHANLKSTSPTTPAQVPLGGSYVRGPATASTSSTTSACCAWSLGSCARSPPSYNASTTPSGVPRELCSLAAVVQHQHGSLGSCVRGPATASTSSTMPARVHGPSGVVSSSCVVSPHANLKSTSPTTPAQVPLGGSYVRGPATASTSSTTSACCAWSLGSCARSLPSYNTSTTPLGVAFVLLLQRPRRL